MLAEEGYKLIVARDGFEAVQIYQKIGKQIGLDESLGRSSDVKELEQMLEKVGVHVTA